MDREVKITLGGKIDPLRDENINPHGEIKHEEFEPIPDEVDSLEVGELDDFVIPGAYGFDPDKLLMDCLGVSSLDGMPREKAAMDRVSKFITREMKARDEKSFRGAIQRLTNAAGPKSKHGLNILLSIESFILKNSMLSDLSDKRDRYRRLGYVK